MPNKRVTSVNDPLVQAVVRIPRSQKQFLDGLKESASGFIRKLIAAQMDGYDIELSKLTEEEKKLEVRLNQVKAQKKQILEVIAKKQLYTQGRERLLEKSVRGLLFSSKVKPEFIFISEFKKYFKARVEGINNKLNGSGAEPFTEQEYFEKFIAMAQGEGVEVHE